VLLGAAVLGVLGLDQVVEQLTEESSTSAAVSLASRVEMWQRGLLMLLDMPLTGIGLNTFPLLLRDYYTPVRFYGLAQQLMPHAHDLYLQTALDVGLIGLAAFLVLMARVLAAGRRALAVPTLGAPAVGLLLGLLAHGLYSLTDAVTLGAKPGGVLWAVCGLLVAAGSLAAPTGPLVPLPRPSVMRRLRRPAVAVGGVLLLAALAPMILLNSALLVVRPGLLGSVLPPSSAEPLLHAASAIGWGPLGERVDVARSWIAAATGDTAGEAAALERAVAEAPWDQSALYHLGVLRMQMGDRAGATAAWKSAGAVDVVTSRAVASLVAGDQDDAAQWYQLATEVAPDDWHAYRALAQYRMNTKQPGAAALLLSQALTLRDRGPVQATLAHRLLDPITPLPADAPALGDSQDADLYGVANKIMQANGDLSGALFATRLAASTEPSNGSYWQAAAALWARFGRPDLAAAAAARAEALKGR
jgi:tetratricopeptide (TPR) repeat protein